MVQLWVADLETGARERIDTGEETDQYIPRIGWTPDGRPWYFRLNRRQNTFEMIVCEPQRSAAHGLRASGAAIWSSAWTTDRDLSSTATASSYGRRATGFMHLYLYSLRRGILEQVTKGPWRRPSSWEPTASASGFLLDRDLAAAPQPVQRAPRRQGQTASTTGEGYYTAAPSAGMKYFITTFSNASTPNRVTEVCDADGNPIRTLADSRRLREELAAADRPVKEFFTFTTERGDTLNAYMVKPRGFDPSQRYPRIADPVFGVPARSRCATAGRSTGRTPSADKGCTSWSAPTAAARGFRGEKVQETHLRTPGGAGGRGPAFDRPPHGGAALGRPLRASASTAGPTADSWP